MKKEQRTIQKWTELDASVYGCIYTGIYIHLENATYIYLEININIMINKGPPRRLNINIYIVLALFWRLIKASSVYS